MISGSENMCGDSRDSILFVIILPASISLVLAVGLSIENGYQSKNESTRATIGLVSGLVIGAVAFFIASLAFFFVSGGLCFGG
jgi:hypothetical protein